MKMEQPKPTWDEKKAGYPNQWHYAVAKPGYVLVLYEFLTKEKKRIKRTLRLYIGEKDAEAYYYPSFTACCLDEIQSILWDICSLGRGESFKLLDVYRLKAPRD